MRIPNNDDIIKFVVRYGIAIFAGLIIMWSLSVFAGNIIYAVKSPNTCTIDEMIVGKVVSLHQDSYVVTEVNDWESLGKAMIELQSYEQ